MQKHKNKQYLLFLTEIISKYKDMYKNKQYLSFYYKKQKAQK